MLVFCADDNPEIRDKFAVLHIDDCGDVVEKVAEVTSYHVKLSEPVFSPRAVLMKVGFPVKISCDVLIYYQPNTPFLKLHVYLIPHDPALKQVIEYLIVMHNILKLKWYQSLQWSIRASVEKEKKVKSQE